MKISLYIIRTQSVYQNALKNFFSSSSLLTEKWNSKISSRKGPNPQNKNAPDSSSLHSRISKLGDQDISVAPVLDQWVGEGKEVDKRTLNNVIRILKTRKRFKHALEISEWMANKLYTSPSRGEIASRLSLIHKVHGLERAEEYYNNISQTFKGDVVDTVLMNCYSQEKLVEKTEAMMQKLRESGCSMTGCYNILMNCYYHVKDWEKIDSLTKEMKEKGISEDKYSFTPRLSAYAATSDIEGLNRTLAQMESDPGVVVDCYPYIVAANAYLRAGSEDKVLEILKKVEELVPTTKGKYKILNCVLTLYAKIGRKDEVYRIWELLKEDNLHNVGYRSMINSLLKFDDIEGAEKIFKEWESKDSAYDFRVSDSLINAYVRKGELEKAEILFNSGIDKGGNPTFRTWYCLTSGYIEDNQVLKGVEVLKNATMSSRCDPYQKPIQDKLVICLEYLERQRDVEDVEELLNSLEAEGIFSSTVCGRLLGFIKGNNSES